MPTPEHSLRTLN